MVIQCQVLELRFKAFGSWDVKGFGDTSGTVKIKWKSKLGDGCMISWWFLKSCQHVAGCTWEFAAMVGYMKKAFPQTQFIVVGFSLGGNIVCKFLGESGTNQERVLCCVSVCQGYSALRWETSGFDFNTAFSITVVLNPFVGSLSRAQETFLQWDRCRRLYNFLMADNMKRIILSHRYRNASRLKTRLWLGLALVATCCVL